MKMITLMMAMKGMVEAYLGDKNFLRRLYFLNMLFSRLNVFSVLLFFFFLKMSVSAVNISMF